MFFSFRTFSTFLLLLTAASCAPVGQGSENPCAHVQGSSFQLNHVAKAVSIKARNGSKDVTDFSTSLVWIEEKDKCDPDILKDNPATCIGKILDVLASYKSAVERVAEFRSCSQFAHEVKPAMQKLHKDISKCVNSRGYEVHEKHNSIEEIQPIHRWQESLLCHYTMDRLFSFSILTARVFALGDPADHDRVSAQKCT